MGNVKLTLESRGEFRIEEWSDKLVTRSWTINISVSLYLMHFFWSRSDLKGLEVGSSGSGWH